MKGKRELERIEGQVESEIVAARTASEHPAVVLTTDDKRKYILQRIGANPFDDTETKSLIGRRVRVEGFDLGSVFRFTKVDKTDVKKKV